MTTEDRSKLGAFFTSLPGIITAVAALLTAVVGTIVALRPDDPEVTQGVNPPTTASVTAQPTDGRQSDPPGPSPESPPSATRTSTPPPQAIDTTAPHDAGTLAVEHGDLLDLSRGTVSNGLTPFDFMVQRDLGNDEVDLASGMGAIAAPIEGTVSKSTCRQALDSRQDKVLSLSVDSIGTWICVLTRDGRFAATRPDRVDPMTGSAELSFVVWK